MTPGGVNKSTGGTVMISHLTGRRFGMGILETVKIGDGPEALRFSSKRSDPPNTGGGRFPGPGTYPRTVDSAQEPGNPSQNK